MRDEKVPNRIAALRQRFVERAAGEREHLALLLHDLRAGTLPEEQRAEMRRLAHSLAGTGGTFGFAEVSDAADRVEEICISDRDSRGAPDDLVAAVEHLVAELARIA